MGGAWGRGGGEGAGGDDDGDILGFWVGWMGWVI